MDYEVSHTDFLTTDPSYFTRTFLSVLLSPALGCQFLVSRQRTVL